MKKSIRFRQFCIIFFILLILYLSNLYSYLLFHTLVEIFTVVVAFVIFILVWNSRHLVQNAYFIFLGIAFLFIAIIDLVHALSFSGMGIFQETGANRPTQLWIAARFMQSISLLIAPFVIQKKFNYLRLVHIYAFFTLLLLFLIFHLSVFPVCFHELSGLTLFKKLSEFIFSIFLLIAIFLLHRRRHYFDTNVYHLLIASILITIASELTFTLYREVLSIQNMIGHYLKFISYYLLYKSIIETALEKPYSLLFRDLKVREEALLESEQKYRNLFENANDSIFIVDPRTNKILDLNETAAFRLGYSKSELCGWNWDKIVIPMTDEQIETIHKKLLADGVVIYEQIHRRKDGSRILVELSSRVITYNKLIVLQNLVHDITSRKEVEKELREAKELAELANRVKSEFLANMSHELRTPLNAIIGFSEILQDMNFGELNARQLEYIKDIKESGELLLSLINDILDLSKIEAGKAVLNYSPIDLESMLQNCLNLIKEKALRHQLTLILNIPASLKGRVIKGDERKLKQIMINLLSNAAKFTPDNGTITVDVALTDKEILITVSDTGIGISKEDQKHVFEDFYQAKGGLADKIPGTGLGLALVKRFVELHGGRIWAQSEGLGKGSQFTFTLPNQFEIIIDDITDLEQDDFLDRIVTDEKLLDDLSHFIHLALKTGLHFSLCCLTMNTEKSLNRMTKLLQIFGDFGKKLKFIGFGLSREIYFILTEVNPHQSHSICDTLVKKLENLFQLTNISYQIAFYPAEGQTAECLLNKVRGKRLPTWNHQHKTVLIAADEPNNLKLAQNILEVSGYATIEATDGQQAIELARSYNPDLILMDIQMPVMDGLEATKVLKADPKTRFIPVIALTAHAMKGDENKVLAAGCEEYITKPLDTQRLLHAVELYLTKNSLPITNFS